MRTGFGVTGGEMTDTRTALLDAGVRLYGTSAAELLKGLSAGSVAEEAGYHRQTFYRYWETQAEYVHDLVRYVLGVDRPPVADGVSELAAHRSKTSLADAAREMAHRDFVRASEDPEVSMRIGLLVMDLLSQPPAADLSQEFYDTRMAALAASYDDLLAAVDREPLDGTTTRDLARTIQGLLYGLVLSARAASDEPYAGELFERAVRVLLEGLTQPVDGPKEATG